MTLVELLLALAVTMLIGASVAGLMAAVVSASARSESHASGVQSARVSQYSMQRLIRGAKLVTACSDHEVVLWAYDYDDPGHVNAEEVVVLRYDGEARTITRTRVEYPLSILADVKRSLNVEVPLASLSSVGNALAAVGSAGNSPFVRNQVIAVDVTSFKASANPPPPMARSVTTSASFDTGNDETLSLRGETSLRADATAQVKQASNGTFDLVELLLDTLLP